MNDTLSIRAVLRDKTVLLTGVTGLVGRMVLHQLLGRAPSLARVVCLVRPDSRRGIAAAERFRAEVLASPHLAELEPELDRHGSSLERLTQVIAGDIGAERLGCDDSTWERLVSTVDIVINCAGLVEFTGPLDASLAANVEGPRRLLELAREAERRGRPVAICHMSTSFVSGPRSGRVMEALPTFDAPRRWGGRRRVEPLPDLLATLVQSAEAVSRRLPADAGDRRAARARKVAMVREGRRQAQRLGWPNIYTLTKALGEHVLWSGRGTVPVSIVRPSVVVAPLHEARGWLEGRDSVTPIAALMLQGQRWFPIARRHCLDTIPVDLVANATIVVAASTSRGTASGVYNLCSSEASVPLTDIFAYTWSGLREAADRLPTARIAGRPVAVPDWLFRQVLEPGLLLVTAAASGGVCRAEVVLDALGRRGAPARLLEGPRELLSRVRASAGRLHSAGLVLDAYAPFFARYRPVFDVQRTRELYDRVTEEDVLRLPFDPENTDWPDYWRDSVMAGVLRFGLPRMGLAPATRA